MKPIKLIIPIVFALLMCNCSYDSEDDLIDVTVQEVPSNPNASTVNYTSTINPIMQSSCVSCHASPPTNGAPFSLVTFTQVSQRATASLNAMSRQSGAGNAMPPSGRLPQSTIDLMQEWIDNGTPEN